MGVVSKTILVTLATIFFLGCHSRFNDTAPEGAGNGAGLTVENRLQANDEMDKKLAKLEASADKIRKLIRQVGRVQGAKADQDVYTHLDLMLDLNHQLKTAPIESKDRKWVKYGTLKLNMKGLSPECSRVETRVENTAPVAQSQLAAAIQDGLIYSVKTCKSVDFVEIIRVISVNSKTSISFNNQNLRQALEDTVVPAARETTTCDIETNDRDVLGRVSCANLTSKLSATEILAIDSLLYDRNEEIRFLLQGRFMAGDVQKGSIYFAINKDGKPDIKIEKTP